MRLKAPNPLCDASLFTSGGNLPKHPAEILLNFAVRETNYPVAEIFKLPGALYVQIFLEPVDLSVHLNNEFACRAVKISDKRTKGRLPAELPAHQLPVAKSLP